MQGGFPTGSAAAECRAPDGAWDEAADAAPRHPALTAAQRAAHLVRALECDVIPRLAATHRAVTLAEASNDPRTPLIVAADIDAFTHDVLRADDMRLAMTLGEWRARGIGVEAILADVLAPTARRFGEMWIEDQCDFTDVTVGLGRLQRLMRELCPAFGTEVAHPPHGRRALLVRAPTEQHSFGLSMVAEFFRRAGWDVLNGGGHAEADAVVAVRREWFDVVGFSVGSEVRMDWLPGCIAEVRRGSRNRRVCVLVGGPVALLRPGLAAEVGADAASSDGRMAPMLAESLLAGRVKRP